MNVSQLARKGDTTTETVRHYTDLGLLRPDRNPDNGYRVYTRDDLERLQFALQARSLGFTLSDIVDLVTEAESGHSPCQHTRELIEARLAEVEQQIAELQTLSGRMRAAMASWSTQPDCQPGANDVRICGLIEAFSNAQNAADAGGNGARHD